MAAHISGLAEELVAAATVLEQRALAAEYAVAQVRALRAAKVESLKEARAAEEKTLRDARSAAMANVVQRVLGTASAAAPTVAAALRDIYVLSEARCRVSEARCRVSEARCRVSEARCRVSATRVPAVAADEDTRHRPYYHGTEVDICYRRHSIRSPVAESYLFTSVLVEDYGQIDFRSCLARYFADAGLPPPDDREYAVRDWEYAAGDHEPCSVAELDMIVARRGLPPIHRSIWFLISDHRRALALSAVAGCPGATLADLKQQCATLARRPAAAAPFHERSFAILTRCDSNYGKLVDICQCCGKLLERGRAERASFIKFACPVCYTWGTTKPPRCGIAQLRPSAQDVLSQPSMQDVRPTCWDAWLERLEIVGPSTNVLEWFALAPEPCLNEVVATGVADRLSLPAEPLSSSPLGAPAAPSLPAEPLPPYWRCNLLMSAE